MDTRSFNGFGPSFCDRSKYLHSCKTEGGEWFDWECIFEGQAPGELGGSLVFPYKDHQLQGFEEWKELKEAKRICEAKKGKWGIEPPPLYFLKGTSQEDIDSMNELYKRKNRKDGCVVEGKEYIHENGQLINKSESVLK